MSDNGDKNKSLLSQWLDFSSEKEEVQNTSSDAREGPLTYGQERLFFLQDVYGSNPFYHYAEVYHFEGSIDVDLLIESFSLVVGHHDILRTTFEVRDDSIIQVIHDELPPIVEQLDLTGQGDPDRKSEHILYDKARLPFELSTGPLVRLVAVKKDDKAIDVLVSMHHIITDKWSMRVLRQDWAAFYSSLIKKEEATGLSSGMRYLDHAIEQKNSPVKDSDLVYWKEKLEGMTEELALDHDFPRPKRMTFEGGFVSSKLGKELSRAVLTSAHRIGVTPYVFLLSAFKVLLHRYSSEEDIIVGSPVSNRNSEDLEASIGFFNETLVLRDDLSPSSPYDELVKAVQDTVMEAFDHAKVPFEVLVKTLRPQRKENVNPLFQVMFLYHDVPPRPKFQDGLDFHYEPFDIGVAKFDLTLYVSKEEDELTTIFEYGKDLFDESRIEEMLGHFSEVLKQVTTRPDIMIKDIGILTSAEEETLRSWGSGPPADLPQKTIIDLFRENVVKTPQAEAAWFGGKVLTYQELDERSDACAHYLISKGIRPGEGVGIMTPPGFDMITAILGIQKAGAFYLPLDPDYPQERLQFMLKDAEVKLILGHSDIDLPGSKVIAVSNAANPSENALPSLELEGPAYMIYTSGSTGQPKGVLVHHDTLLNSTLARLEYYPEAKCRYLLLSSFSFDSSVAGIFWPLVCGGCLVMVPRRSEQDVEGLTKTIAVARVTHTLLLPSLYRVILDVSDANALSSLKVIIVAGEACPPALIKEHFEKAGQVRLYNEYGPTEATVWCSVEEILASSTPPVPIGGPISNTKLYVLDKGGRLCPKGVSGDLFIAGKNVTKGYHGREDLTMKRFSDDPFGQGKMYRTGDRAKWNKDGRLIFLGRRDGQVKVRGHRIELQAIQHRLESHEDITRAEVIITEKGNQARIAGFYTSKLEEDEGELKRFLAAFLPAYMTPDQLIRVEDFPRLPNGKVDQAALELLIANEKTTELKAAQSKEEEALVQSWKEVLKLEEVSTTDNFFAVGGDSIKTIQVLAHLRKQGYALKTEDIFSYQTIGELAHVLKRAQAPKASQVAISGSAPFLPAHDWHFKLHQTAPGHWGQGYSLTLDKAIDIRQLDEAVGKLLDHHDGLRAKFDPKSRTMIIDPTSDQDPVTQVNLELDRTGVIEKEMSGMDPAYGHLFKVIAHEGEDITALVLIAHHLVVDAFSWPIILEDLHSLLLDANKALPSRTDSILSWAKEVDQLDDEVPWSKWNYDVPPWPGISYKDIVQEAEINTSIIDLDNAFEIDNSLGLKVHEALLVSLATALAKSVNTEHLLVDLEGLGREIEGSQLDVSRTVGWLTSIYAIPFKIAGEAQLGDTAIQVKEALRSVPDQGLSFHRYQQKHQVLPSHPCRMVFNFLGELSQASYHGFKQLSFEVDGVRDPRSERNYLIEINIIKDAEHFKVNISYHAASLGEEWLTTFVSLIRQTWSDLVKMLTEGEQKYTPGDFPDVDISQDDLDLLMDQF